MKQVFAMKRTLIIHTFRDVEFFSPILLLIIINLRCLCVYEAYILFTFIYRAATMLPMFFSFEIENMENNKLFLKHSTASFENGIQKSY